MVGKVTLPEGRPERGLSQVSRWTLPGKRQESPSALLCSGLGTPEPGEEEVAAREGERGRRGSLVRRNLQ